MQHKSFETDATIPLGEGELIGYASTFGNVDKVADVVMPGAFSEDVPQIKSGAVKVPLIWGHDHAGSPQNWVGQITDANETDEGLEVHARFDLEDPVARKAWRLVKDGRIDKLSIGYTVPPGGSRRKGNVTELHQVSLREVSLVLTPANSQARVLSIKSHDETVDTSMFDVVTKAITEVNVKFHRQRLLEQPVEIKSYEIG
jgi:HK97 family phage prohead protease